MAEDSSTKTSAAGPKTYDVIILGASGFTGKYVVREALKFLDAPNSPLKSLALAGRSPSRLLEALKWAAGPEPLPEIPIITVDTADPDSLSRLAEQAKILLNCVGPFRLYGQPVVRACVDAGCDYLDVSGEPEFMERVEDLYHGKAVERGSLVVSACAFISVVAELGLMFHVRQWAGPLAPDRVEAYLSMESDRKITLNFGSFQTILANRDMLLEPERAQPTIPGQPSSKGSLIEHQKKLGVWAIKSPSADSIVVQRTLSTLAENSGGLPGVNESEEHCRKREAFWSSIKPTHFGLKLVSKSMFGFFQTIMLGIFAVLLGRFDFGRRLLLKFPSLFSFGLFRKEGPTEDEVASSRFKMWFVGHGSGDGSTSGVSPGNKKPDTEVITRVTGPEIGYIATPIILIQCALVLLNDRDNLPRGGVYTPGIVFGPTDLQERLQANGISFDFISKNALSA